jgi:gamma-glutamyltranspeptidase/glutathione hydrolase
MMFFLLGAALSSIGPGNISTTALLAPIAMPVAARAGIPAFLMAIMVGNGANAGSLSPFAPTGIIVTGTMARIGLSGYEWTTYANNLVAHIVVAFAGYLLLGGVKLFRASYAGEVGAAETEPFDRKNWMTLAVIAALIVSVIVFRVNVGMGAFIGAVVLAAFRVADHHEAIKRMPWGVIVMVSGVTVLIALLERFQGIDLVTSFLARFADQNTVTGVVGFVTAFISVYSSTSGVVLPAFLPTIPGLIERLGGGDPIAIASAMNVSSHLVDVSPLSTIGALCLAALPASVMFAWCSTGWRGVCRGRSSGRSRATCCFERDGRSAIKSLPMSIPINRSQARSLVVTRHGVVASEHPLASQAGAMVLADGGHAVDAAIAANAVMGVVCPMMCGIGGDLFAIVWEQDGRMHGVNGSGWAPSRLTPDLLEAHGSNGMPQSGVHSVTVPGTVAGWALLSDRFGRRPLATILAEAIGLADEGFPVAEITAEEWHRNEPFLREDPDAARTFLPAGRAMKTGDVFRNPDLAWAYRQIAEHGRGGFYQGEVARRLIAGLEQRGGVMASGDLSEFQAEWVEPISTNYRGWDVFEIPPNGAGIAALMMLNILETQPMGEYGPNSVEALHAMIEAKKFAYADMQRYVADPRFSRIPVSAMLDKGFARTRAKAIDASSAQAAVSAAELPVHAGDTVYLSVADRDGNMVSLIQSNFAGFGSGVVAAGTGFPLQNRGALFTLDRAHPNVLAPRKRPLHTIIPAFMRQGDTRVAFGIMGGWNQSQAHAQFVSNVVDHGLNIQAALEAPRFTKLTFDGRDVTVERRIPEPVRHGLAAKGHEVVVEGDFCSLMGGGQAVMRTNGVNYGASDPRKDGAAVPEP